VGSDQDIDLAVCQITSDLAHFSIRSTSRDHLDPDRISSKSLLKGLQMLVGKNRGWRQQGNLVTALHGLKGRPHGYFGLAETDIAAEQTIHRAIPLEVLLDGLNSHKLILCLFVVERGLELRHQITAFLHGWCGSKLAFGIELNQIARQLLHTPFDTRLGTAPGGATKPIQTWRETLDTAVALDLVEPTQRQQETPPPCVLDLHHLDISRAGSLPQCFHLWRQTVSRSILFANGAQGHKLSDPVLGVHYIVANSKISQTRDEGSIARPGLAPARCDARE
jgi:hypothetical protein